MRFFDFFRSFASAILFLIANVLLAILYMVVYGHLIDPGHPEEYYQEHIQVAGPYCSILAGFPLMVFFGWWIAGWKPIERAKARGWVLVVSYIAIDLSILLLATTTWTLPLLLLAAISHGSKIIAVLLGIRLRGIP